MHLADIAPRLARARDQHVAEMARRAAERRRLREKWRRASWLVTHRELQLLRAYATGDARYINRRARKLDQARAQLDAVNAGLEAAA